MVAVPHNEWMNISGVGMWGDPCTAATSWSIVYLPQRFCVIDYLENSTLLGQPPSTGTYKDTVSFEHYHTKEKKQQKL
jgi:hypothetical protein